MNKKGQEDSMTKTIVGIIIVAIIFLIILFALKGKILAPFG